MDFLDTQIISYKYKNNKSYADEEIKGKQISSIVALEFLRIMEKNTNKAKFYPVIHGGINRFASCIKILFEKNQNNFFKSLTDKVVIDFNGEFERIIIFSNKAVSFYVNNKSVEGLVAFAEKNLDRKDLRELKDKTKFLIDNNIKVVPLKNDTIIKLQEIYERCKKEKNYNFKNDYRNSFMDLLILATALGHKEHLITKDKELKKLVEKYCDDIDTKEIAKDVFRIGYSENKENTKRKNDTKGYKNNSWRLIETNGKKCD